MLIDTTYFAWSRSSVGCVDPGFAGTLWGLVLTLLYDDYKQLMTSAYIDSTAHSEWVGCSCVN